jgi:glyoxalase family protein
MTKGIHHITAISSDPQKTYDFYSKILGLRLVKKSVNQDDTETYHLFFGDRYGHPGMDLTFFTFQPVRQGQRGNGFVTKIAMSVPKGSLAFWKDRFTQKGIKHHSGQNTITFYDGDDQQLELVGVENTEDKDVWITSEISAENAIQSFYSATLTVAHRSLVEPILVKALGYNQVKSEGKLHTFRIEGSDRAAFIEVEETDTGNYGMSGAGTVHHIAFRVKDLDEELEIRKKLTDMGLVPTEVIDRYYFKSVYFRTPAGILFEMATDEPGFTADEQEEELGKKLALPPFLEKERKIIEAHLTPIITE